MNKRPSSPFLRALDALLEGRTGSWVINLFVIPVMILLVLILPPLSLPQRVLSAGYTGIAPKGGGTVSLDDGTYFSIPAGALKSDAGIRLDSIQADVFAKNSAAQNLPPTLQIESPAYEPSLQGSAPPLSILSIPIPDDANPITTLDVYGYDGKNWSKFAFQAYPDDQRVEAHITSVMPRYVVLVQTQAQAPTISADLTAKSQVPTPATALIAEVNPVGLTIADSGGISGSVPQLPEASASSPYQVLPTVDDFDGTETLGGLVDDMVSNSDTRSQHVQALVDLTVEKLYPGLNIDYQDVNADNQADFTSFVRELAGALHAKDKILSVTLPLPTQESADAWDTGAYDWGAIGNAADIVKIPLPTTRDAYVGDNAPVQMYLQWAVGQIDRYKLQITFSAMGRDEFDGSFAPIGFSSAAKLMGPVDAPTLIPPDTKVPLDLPKLRDAGGIKLDAASGLYSFGYKDDKGQAHTVWLETAGSLLKKLGLAQEFNVRGVALRDLNGDAVESRMWNVLTQYHNSATPAVKGTLSVVWRVNGQTVGKTPATDPRFTWTAPTQNEDAKIEATLSFDDGQTVAANAGSLTAQVQRPVLPTAVPPPVVAVAPPTPKPAAPAGPAPSAFVGQNLFSYGAQLNWTNSDNNAEMGSLNQLGFKWAKIQVRWCDVESAKGVADLSQIDRLIGAATAHGIKVLFSVVCAPNWSRADRGAGGSGPPDNMQDAADFMGGLAAKYCGGALGAIEVWNEHNLLTEWHGKPISAVSYMDMLKRAYTSIKAKCPSVVVVSGAPTPTGVTSDTAIDDVTFLTQLYQNGLKQYSDAIGAHPSGFGNPPDVPAGTPNPTGQFQGHRSFYFRGTMETYRQVMVQFGDGNKQIWPTEFGWGVDPSPKPGYEYEKFISLDQQAAWLVKAYQEMKAWGWVGTAILWNLDFTDLSNETGAFNVMPPRPAFGALAGMAK